MIHVEPFTCAICGVKHTRYRDAGHTRAASYCHSCHAAQMRRTRPKYSELPEWERRAMRARSYANTYQARGKLAPEPCSLCGIQGAEKHHEDYSHPLAVTWLCRGCHLALHRGRRAQPKRPLAAGHRQPAPVHL